MRMKQDREKTTDLVEIVCSKTEESANLANINFFASFFLKISHHQIYLKTHATNVPSGL